MWKLPARNRRGGLGGRRPARARGVEFVTPDVTTPATPSPPVEPAVAEPLGPPPEAIPAPAATSASPPPPIRLDAAAKRTLRRTQRVFAVGLGLVLLLGVVANTATTPPPLPKPPPTRAPLPPRVPDAPTVWTTSPGQLRPDLNQAVFVPSLSGAFSDDYLVNAGSTWLVLTDVKKGNGEVIHALDPATGRERWQARLPDALCAETLLADGIVCAEAIDRDPATRLGTRWRVQVLDPATGAVRRAREIDGWFSLIRVHGERIMLVEQRQPAPHAAFVGLASDLSTTWTIDLGGQLDADDLFSRNRLIVRPIPQPEGPALFRPRLRVFEGGASVGLWAGSRLVLIDPATGTLRGLPWCSRLLDDGKRLWCNEPKRAVAYSYRLDPLVSTQEGVRLAFVTPSETTVVPAVFVDSDGRLLRVDPDTGATQGVILETRLGSAFGQTTEPSIYAMGRLALVSSGSTTTLVEPATGTVLWKAKLSLFDPPVQRGGRWLVRESSSTHVLHPSTGEIEATYWHRTGSGPTPAGDGVVSVNSEGLARLDLP